MKQITEKENSKIFNTKHLKPTGGTPESKIKQKLTYWVNIKRKILTSVYPIAQSLLKYSKAECVLCLFIAQSWYSLVGLRALYRGT